MDELDLNAVAFPKLTSEQIAEIAECSKASRLHFAPGDILFQVGDRDFPFFILESGSVEIYDTSGDTPQLLKTHEQGDFTGDISHLTGRAAIVTGVATTASDVVAMPGDALRELLNVCPTLGDTILKAFIARRQLIRESGVVTGVRVIGSRYSHDTFRITDFLASNRLLYTWLDLENEGDAEVTTLLERFGLEPSRDARRDDSGWPVAQPLEPRACRSARNPAATRSRRPTTWPLSAPGRQASRPPSTAHRRGSTR